MKILIAPDSFKGSLSAGEICNIVEKAAIDVFGQVEIGKLPVADGGEGTVEAILEALNGEEVKVEVKSPDFRNIIGTYGIFNKTNAIMEMAEASGITLVEERNIFKMNTFGTGEMILDAIQRGVDTIYIGIGGSATNDLGAGFASALGVKFLDKDGNEVYPIPENFHLITDIDESKVSEKVKNTKFVIMSDVKNPLLGETGATYIFGKQKCGCNENLDHMESRMTHLAKIIEEKKGISISNIEGAGAAGGLGAGLLAFTNSEIKSGVFTILDILEFKKHLEGTSLVVTGEGRMDNQSSYGKVPFGVGSLCKEKNIPCVAIVGGLGDKYEEIYNHGVNTIITTTDRIMPLEEALDNAEYFCYTAAVRLFKGIQVGMSCV